MAVLTLIGAPSIQEFIFRTNKLKENVAASNMLNDAFLEWGKGALKQYCVYATGGHAALRFPDCEEAKRRIFEWSEPWLRKAPGLRFAVAHTLFDEHDDADAKRAWQQAKHLFLPQKESEAPQGIELGAFPVVAQCPVSRLAASTEDDRDAWISAESKAKRDYPTAPAYANRVCNEDFPNFPEDLDRLGLPPRSSQIAVVVIDANGMGNYLDKACQNTQSNQSFLELLKEKSRKLSEVTLDSAVQTFIQIRDKAHFWNFGPEKQRSEIDLCPIPNRRATDHERWYLPVRPLIVGGDDVCFVCPAQIAFGAAEFYIRTFECLSKKILGETRTACCGVAIVGAGFPFARAYDMAQELTSKAKEQYRKIEHEEGIEASCIDYVLVTEGATRSVKQTRGQGEQSHIGPWALLPEETCLRADIPSWEQVKSFWTVFRPQNEDQPGVWKRSRAKTLFQKFGESESALKECVEIFQRQGYTLPGNLNPQVPGDLKKCYAPLELLDFPPKWRDPGGSPNASPENPID